MVSGFQELVQEQLKEKRYYIESDQELASIRECLNCIAKVLIETLGEDNQSLLESYIELWHTLTDVYLELGYRTGFDDGFHLANEVIIRYPKRRKV